MNASPVTTGPWPSPRAQASSHAKPPANQNASTTARSNAPRTRPKRVRVAVYRRARAYFSSSKTPANSAGTAGLNERALSSPREAAPSRYEEPTRAVDDDGEGVHRPAGQSTSMLRPCIIAT